MVEKATNIAGMINAFSPRELSGEDLDKYYYDKTMPVRTGSLVKSPIDDIFDACHDPSLSNKFLLMGHRGCGKSTELNVLSRRFQNEGFPVHTVQCAKELDMTRPFYSDLMILMGDALIEIAKEINCEIDKNLLNDLVHYWDNITEIKDRIEQYDLSATGGAGIPSLLEKILGLFLDVKGSVRLSEGVRETYEKRIDDRLGEWISILNKIADSISTATQKQPIIIFEELDKLADIDAEQETKDKSWELFFARPSALASFSFPIIFTFPIALSYEPRFGALKGYFHEKFFPMIKVTSIENKEFTDGCNAIKAIIEKRADENLFDKNVEDYMIEKTGGALRDLFDAIRQSATYASRRKADSISMDDAVLALEEIQSEITRRIEKKDYDFLKDIYNGNRRGISDRKALLGMLLAGVVLEYNGKRWCNLHPLVADYLVDLGVVEKREGDIHEPTVGKINQ
ncbi:hypothetical protein J5690_02620 [bacterium]|nr:hypothetical protein [bacterium]